MRVLFVISALSLATFVCALPADNADDDFGTFDEPMSLIQEAQKTVSDMKSKGASHADCKELATELCAEVEKEVADNQKTLNDLPNGNQCLNLGQDAVAVAQADLDTKTADLTAAEKAVTDASNTQVAVTAPTVGTLEGHLGNNACVSFISGASNYAALKKVLDDARAAKSVAEGAKTQATTSLQNAKDAAAKLKNDCLCLTKKNRDEKWALLGAAALRTTQETAKAKCRMMTCVLEGTPTSQDSCKSDLTAITKKTLIDQAEHSSCAAPVWSQQSHTQCGSTGAENAAAAAAGVHMHSPGRTNNSHLHFSKNGMTDQCASKTLAQCKARCLANGECRGIEFGSNANSDSSTATCCLMYSGTNGGGWTGSCWKFTVDGSVPPHGQSY